MTGHRINAVWGLGILIASGCISEQDALDPTAVTRQSAPLSAAGSAAISIKRAPAGLAPKTAQPAATQITREAAQGITDMRLALLDKTRARLMFRMGAMERQARKVSDDKPVVSLTASQKDKSIDFNDMGQQADKVGRRRPVQRCRARRSRCAGKAQRRGQQAAPAQRGALRARLS